MGLLGSDDNVSREEVEEYIAEDAGSSVKPKWINKIESMLDSGEEVYYMMKPGDVKHNGNQSAATPGSGGVIAAFTGERIVIKVGHFWEDDQFIIRYPRIQSVQWDSSGVSGMVGLKNLVINTANDEYKIGTGDQAEEIDEIVSWIDKKSAEARSSDSDEQTSDSGGGGEKSVTERLEELEELHEKGLVDDDEYDTKKNDLLEEL